MATSVEYLGLTGSQTAFTINFDYLKKNHVKAKIDGAVVDPATYTVDGSTVTFNTAPVGDLLIYRDTDISAKLVTFTRAAPLRASDLNLQSDQVLFSVQEADDTALGLDNRVDSIEANIGTRNVTNDGAALDTAVNKLSGIEAGADVTDSANVTSALGSISINAHSDVNTPTPSDTNVLAFNGTSGKWEPSTAGSGDLHSSKNLSDVVDAKISRANLAVPGDADANDFTGANSFLAGVNFTLKDPTDTTKQVRVDASGITTGTIRTKTVQDVSGTLYETGGQDVSVADGGTGASTAAAARTNLDAAQRISDFRDYGATGGGATSNRTAMDAVITAAAKSLFVPEGNYQWTADADAIAFDVPNAFSFVGNGLASRLTFDNSKAAHMLNYDGDAHCYVGSMRLDHASDGTYTGAHIIRATGLGLDASIFNGLLLENAQNYAIGLQGGPITATVFNAIIVDGTEDDAIDFKNTDDANEANVFSAMVVRNHSQNNSVVGKPAYDFRGPVVASGVAAYGFGLNRGGTANNAIGMRFRTGELLDANGFGGHYSTAVGVYLNAEDSTDTFGFAGNAYDVATAGTIIRGASIGYELKGPRQIFVAARAISPTSDGFRTEDGGTAVTSADDISLIGCNVTGTPTRGFSIEGEDNFLIGVRSESATTDLTITAGAARTVVIGGQFTTISDSGTDTTLLGIPTTKNNLVTTGGFEVNQVGGNVLLDITNTGSGVGGAAISDIAWTVRKDGANETMQRLVSNVGASGDRVLNILTPLTDSLADAFRIQTGNALAIVVDATTAALFDSTGKTLIKPASSTDVADYDLHVKGSLGVNAGVGTTRTPVNIGDWVLQISSNSAVRIKVKGTDGVVRESADITLS